MRIHRSSLVVPLVGFLILIGAFFLVQNASIPRGTPKEAEAPSLYAPKETRTAAPQNIIVPGLNMKGLAAHIAIPDSIAPGSLTKNVMRRNFTIRATPTGFSPSTVIVNKGDTTRLTIEAGDRAIDIVQPDYGFHFQIPTSSSEIMEFQATADGIFTFYCSICGDTKPMVGYIVIKP
jgi:plastocyanin